MMKQKKHYSATIFGAWIFMIVAVVVWFSGMPESRIVAAVIAIIAALLFMSKGRGIIFAKPSDIAPKVIDESDNTMVILGDPDGYEVSAQEAFGYTYSITQPELWFGWNDTEYISNKLSSHNMYVRVPKRYIK